MFLNKFGNFLNVFLVLYLVDEGFSASEAGIALGVVGIGSFVGNAIGGTVADRVGRRAAIAVSMFGSGAATLAVPLVHGWWLTTGLVGLVGVFAQLYRPAAGALLVDVVPENQRVRAFAVFRLAINVGMAVGPLVGGLLSQTSYVYIFVGDALSSFAFGLLVLLMLPGDSPPQQEEPTAEGTATLRKDGYRTVFTDRPFVLFLLSMVAATFVYSQSTATLPLHVRDEGLDNSVYGLLLGLNAVICVLFELPLTRRTERMDPRWVIAIGMVLLGVGMGLTGAAGGVVMIGLTVALWSLAEITYTPVANAYPGDFSPPHLRGRYQGADGIAHTLAGALGPAIGGFLYAYSAPVHWLTCAAVAVLGALLVLKAKPNKSETAIATVSGQGESAEAARS
jgi:MFS family permease